MGCTTSSLEPSSERTSYSNSTKATTTSRHSSPQDSTWNHLHPPEVLSRRSGSVEAGQTILGDLRSGHEDDLIYVRYAVLTQRGFYPSQPHKPNQDSYCLHSSQFASGEGDALFAVFDGHGRHGHICSTFASQKLPGLLAQKLRKARARRNWERLSSGQSANTARDGKVFHPREWPYLEQKDYERCCREAYTQWNAAMHAHEEIDDTMSGTTAICVGFHAGRITITNVGNSRAILGHRIQNHQTVQISNSTPQEEEKKEISDDFHETDEYYHHDYNQQVLGDRMGRKWNVGDIVAIPLSQNQTPYRQNEKETLKIAEVQPGPLNQRKGMMSLQEQSKDNERGSITDDSQEEKGDNHPGIAFSRSLGDSLKEDIDGIVRPEILTKMVTKGDEILVIASDGIFQFLTNQRVIDICAKCHDPVQACSNLLDASYEKWLDYELCVDDMTCIVIFMMNSRDDDPEFLKNGRT